MVFLYVRHQQQFNADGRRTPNGPPTTLPYLTFNYNAKNQLTSYTKEGTTKYYEYDNMGNPVKYGANSQSAADNFAWTQGTKLKTGTYKGNTFSYKYNADGLRYEKTVNGVTTRQYLEGDKIIAEEEVNANNTVVHTKYYIYDQTGIAGMVYDGTPYYFAKNMFGDVVSVHTETGAYAGGYEYDAWGNITSGGGSGIGAVNPFRYRGYYYDQETELYYLQTRYYDPEIGRFITIDGIEYLDPKTINGLNLYAYCGDNPVMFTDPNGTAKWWEWLLGVLIIAVAIVATVFTAGLAAPIAAAVGGGLAGAIIGGAVAGAVSGAIMGFAFSVATQKCINAHKIRSN